MEPEIWAEIKRLHEIEHISVSEIARRLRVDRKTVRRAMLSVGLPVVTHARTRPSILDPFKGYIRERIEQYPHLTGTVILREIQTQGYRGKIRIVTEHLTTLRQKAREVFLRIETAPGEQAQVDWADCGTVQVGHAKRKLSVFVMVLSWSRMMYIEFRLSQNLDDFLDCHLHAFKFFGGITRKILYDNLKLVVLERLGSRIRFNPRFLEFSGVFGFEPVLCNIARGNEKGKVESGIGYLRTSFLEGRNILWPQIQEQGQGWLAETANVRLHRTTREKPVDRWELEKPHLLTVPDQRYDLAALKTVRSTHQALVRYDGNAYSVPFSHAYQTLQLRSDLHTISILSNGKEIASHPRCYDRGAVIEDPSHFKGILAAKKKALASRLYKSFLDLGEIAGDYLEGLADAELHIGPHIAKIMELVGSYGKGEVLEAMTHAFSFKAFGAGYVQNILHQKRTAKGLKEILPITIPQNPSWNEIRTEEPDLELYDNLD